MPFTNYELRITNFKSAFRFFVILCVFVVSARIYCAQDDSLPVHITREEINLLPYQTIFQTATTKLNVERKRDALLELRNYRTATASRIAVPALKDSSDIVRATAAASAVFLPSDEAARHLLPLLADKKPFVRREAAYALGAVRSPNAINSLLQIAQKDKVAEVRNAAIIALGEIGDAAAVGELVKFLQRKPQAKEEFTRRSAARAIGQIAQIIQTNKAKILTPENFLPDKLKEIEKPNHPKLSDDFLAFRSAISVLTEVLRNRQDFPDVKREAAFALGAIGDVAAVPVLQVNLANADYYLAEICRESLRKIAVYAEYAKMNASSR
jgi:HEAT repeat protein